MDGYRFDDLVKMLAIRRSRRSFVRAALGAFAGIASGLVGHDVSTAAGCREPGRTCREHVNCCSGYCGPKDATGRRRCLCQTPADCPTSTNTCLIATCTAGVCGLAPDPAAVGLGCDDGDLCTDNDVCQADGSCAGTLIECSFLDGPCTQGVCVGGGCQAQNINEGGTCTPAGGGSGTCTGGVCQPTCAAHGAVCSPSTGLNCCTDIVCDTTSCSGGALVCCQDTGGACSSDCDCCIGRTCQSGVCAD